MGFRRFADDETLVEICTRYDGNWKLKSWKGNDDGDEEREREGGKKWLSSTDQRIFLEKSINVWVYSDERLTKCENICELFRSKIYG